LLCKAPVCL
nr:immunoglobulin heavy chain junction region [Mus musculus]